MVFLADRQPSIGDGSHLIETVEQLRIQHPLTTGLVEPFDQNVRVGFAWLDTADLDVVPMAPLGPRSPTGVIPFADPPKF